MTKLDYIDNFFFANYINRKGFWYAFKRSVNDIGNLYLLFRYLQVYKNKNWFKNQKEYSDILIKEKILIPTRSSQDASANARGIKKVFELLGFCYIDENEKLQITEAGHKFLDQYDNDHLYKIKTDQLIKYQLNNPLIKSNSYKNMQIKPFVFLLELLTKIDNQSIDMTEYKLFVCRAHNHNEIDLILKQIIEWRKLNDENKKQILERINNSDIFNLISGYASYSLSFFGKSTYTDISEIEDEKILYLKKNEYNKVQKILKIPKISNFKKDLDTQERFIEYYGSLPKKTQKPLVKNEIKKSNDNFKINFLSKITSNLNTDEKEKILLDRQIEDLFFLSGRTLNTLKNEQIIFLKDLLIWEEDNLKKMQGMGERSIRELKEQIHELNRKNYTNLKFFISKIESKITINSFEKEFVQDAKITMNTNVEDSIIGEQFVLNNESSKLFKDLSNDDKINFFRKIDLTFDNVRILNVCKNLELNYLGDLHQNDKTNLLKNHNLGVKSIDRIFKILNKFINLPFGMIIKDWNDARSLYRDKYSKLLADKMSEDHKSEFHKLEFLDDEIRIFNKKIGLSEKQQNVIDYHYGLDGSGIKTLQVSGDKFGITRERVRQITQKYLRKVEKKSITGLRILLKINELLKQNIPIKTTSFEKLLLNKKLVKRRFTSATILSLVKHYAKLDNHLMYENKQIIDSKINPSYKKILRFFESRNINTFGILNVNFVAKKFKLSPAQLVDFLSIRSDLTIVNNTWIYDNDKSRNRLYNLLQKIFNVNSRVNKFQISDALKRNSRINTPNLEAIILYCKNELAATENDADLIVPKNMISAHFYNSSIKVLADIDQKIISCFKNDKLLTYRNLVSKLLDLDVPVATANIYAAYQTPVIIKVRPRCYALVGTKFYPGEKDEFYEKNKKLKGEKIISDYDHNSDGSIWVGFEINSTTRDRQNFKVESSIYDILRGDYSVKGMNHKINVNNQKYISRLANDIFKDKIKIGDEIIFTFDVNNRKVDIEIGKNLMKNKYN